MVFILTVLSYCVKYLNELFKVHQICKKVIFILHPISLL